MMICASIYIYIFAIFHINSCCEDTSLLVLVKQTTKPMYLTLHLCSEIKTKTINVSHSASLFMHA